MFSIAAIFISWARPLTFSDTTRREVDEVGAAAETEGNKIGRAIIHEIKKQRKERKGVALTCHFQSKHFTHFSSQEADRAQNEGEK